MKFTPILVLLLLSNLVFSQSKKENKKSYGIEIQPRISKFNLEDEGLGEAYDKAGATVSGLVFYHLHPQLSFKTGLGINITKLSQKDYSPSFGCDFDGTTVDLFQSWQTLDFSIYYLSIPAHLKWNFTNKKNHPYLKIGADLLFRFASRGSQVIHECGTNLLESDQPTHDFSPFLIFTSFGIGYEFELKQKRKFYIEPNIAYALKPLFRESNSVLKDLSVPYNSHILNLSLAAGITF